jgi:hypothetical protein
LLTLSSPQSSSHARWLDTIAIATENERRLMRKGQIYGGFLSDFPLRLTITTLDMGNDVACLIVCPKFSAVLSMQHSAFHIPLVADDHLRPSCSMNILVAEYCIKSKSSGWRSSQNPFWTQVLTSNREKYRLSSSSVSKKEVHYASRRAHGRLLSFS